MSTTEAATHLFENPFELARGQLRRVGEIFGVDPNLVNVLAECKKTVEVSVPVSMDDGADQGVPGLPRRAQRHARPGEGRDPLPPGR